MRYFNRFTVITVTLLGLVAITAILDTDFSGSWDRVRDTAPSLPTEDLGGWWQPAWSWVQQNYLIAIGVTLVLLLPATRQVIVPTILFLLPVVIVMILFYHIIMNDNWHAVVYNGVDAIFDWVFNPLLPENYDR